MAIPTDEFEVSCSDKELASILAAAGQGIREDASRE
jgi:hypothetical protein